MPACLISTPDKEIDIQRKVGYDLQFIFESCQAILNQIISVAFDLLQDLLEHRSSCKIECAFN